MTSYVPQAGLSRAPPRNCTQRAHALGSDEAVYSLVLLVRTRVASFTFHRQMMRTGLVFSLTAIFGKMNRYSV